MNDMYFLKRAYQIGQEESTDPSTKIGAVLVSNDEIICQSANRFPNGVKQTPERLKRPESGLYGGKYYYFSHAENSLICKAASEGIRTKNLTMYCGCWTPCTVCCRAIIDAGIGEIVCHKTFNTKGWDEEAKVSLAMFQESGILYREVEGEIGIYILKGGQKVKI